MSKHNQIESKPISGGPFVRQNRAKSMFRPNPFEGLEPAPPEVAKCLNWVCGFDNLKETGQKAICDFYFFIAWHLSSAKDFDTASKSSSPPEWFPRPLSPAMREKLRSIRNRLSNLIRMAERVKGKDLLVAAQSKLQQFQEQPPPATLRPYTGKIYLQRHKLDWLVRPPAVAYGFFILLRRHSTLNKQQAYERIARLHKSLFGINVETDSIKKMISRFNSDARYRRMNRFLVKVESLPPVEGTK